MIKIYPIVSNVIEIELAGGSIFRLREDADGLNVQALNGGLVASEYNGSTLGLDEVWRGKYINLAVEA